MNELTSELQAIKAQKEKKTAKKTMKQESKLASDDIEKPVNVFQQPNGISHVVQKS